MRTSSRLKWLPIAALVAAGLTFSIFRFWEKGPRDKGESHDEQPRGERLPKGFQDAAAACGIDFQMNFIAEEQGENFKINLYDHGAGVVVGDYDGDGHDDVLFLNQLGPNGLYRNLGDGRFENVTAKYPAVALDDRICVGGTFADYDNDGDQDLYITSTRGGNVLLENQGGSGFRDVTDQAGVGCTAHSQTAAFFDYNNDGYLDLLVTNTAKWTSSEYRPDSRHYLGPRILDEFIRGPEDFESNLLFRNNQDGTFTEVAVESGVGGRGWSGDVAVFDYDDDGDLDLYLTNMFGWGQMLNNDGQGRFTDVTEQTLKQTSFGAIGCKAFDYNNDGRLDLFVADMHSDMWLGYDDERLIEPRTKYRYFTGRRFSLSDRRAVREEAAAAEEMKIDYQRLIFGNTLYRNEGEGAFREVSDEANLETFWPWGVATGDFDNDGHEDIYLPSGMGYPFFYWPSSLMLNCGDGTFRDENRQQGIEPPVDGIFLPQAIGGKRAARSSRCAATGDFDGDGRLEIVVNNFNDRPYYFRNQFPKANFVELRLTGTKSNRDAIGAVVKLHYAGGVMVRQVHCAGGYLSQSSKVLHFGLGEAKSIERAEIRWPSGTIQTVEGFAVNTLHAIREGDP